MCVRDGRATVDIVVLCEGTNAQKSAPSYMHRVHSLQSIRLGIGMGRGYRRHNRHYNTYTYITAAPVGEAVGDTIGVVGEEQQRGGGGFWRWRSPALGALPRNERNEVSPKLDGGSPATSLGELVGGDVKIEVETFAEAREARANWPSQVEMLKRLVQAHILKSPLHVL